MRKDIFGFCIALLSASLLSSCMSIVPTDKNGQRLKDSECEIVQIQEVYGTQKKDDQLLKDLKKNLSKIYANTINSSGASSYGADASLAYRNFTDTISEAGKAPLKDTSMLLTIIDVSHPGWKLQYSIQLDYKPGRVRMTLDDFHGFAKNGSGTIVEARINRNAFWYAVYSQSTENVRNAVKDACEKTSGGDW